MEPVKLKNLICMYCYAFPIDESLFMYTPNSWYGFNNHVPNNHSL